MKHCFAIFEVFSFDFSESFIKLLFSSGIIESVFGTSNDLLETKTLRTLMWKYSSFVVLVYVC